MCRGSGLPYVKVWNGFGWWRGSCGCQGCHMWKYEMGLVVWRWFQKSGLPYEMGLVVERALWESGLPYLQVWNGFGVWGVAVEVRVTIWENMKWVQLVEVGCGCQGCHMWKYEMGLAVGLSVEVRVAICESMKWVEWCRGNYRSQGCHMWKRECWRIKEEEEEE